MSPLISNKSLSSFVHSVRKMATQAAQPLCNALPESMIQQMTARLSRIFTLFTQDEDTRVRRTEEAYLAKAFDLQNLEYRMRELDRKRHAEHYWS
jgi:hypothetical protein